MQVVALEVQYGDVDRPVVEVRVGDAWLPGEVHRSVHKGTDWQLQVLYAASGIRHLHSFPAAQVRALSFSVETS